MSGATIFVGRSARQQHHAPHPTRPPRPLPSYPLPACLLGSLGCWARGRRLGGPSVSRHPLAGWKHMGPCGPTDFRVIC